MYLRGRAVSCRLQPPFSPQELPERDQPGGQCRVARQGWDLLSSQEAELFHQATAPCPVRPARGAHGRGKCLACPLVSGCITSHSAPHTPAPRHRTGSCDSGGFPDMGLLSQPLDTHVDAVLRGPLGCKWGPGLQGGRHRFGPWPVSWLVVGSTLESQVHMRCCSFPAFSSDLGRSGGPGQHASPHLRSQGGRCAHVSSPAHCSSEGLT